MGKIPTVWTVLSLLEWATSYFASKNIPDPRLSIEWILAEALHCKRLDLYLQFDRPLSGDELNAIRPMVKRRAEFEPLQYITGSAQFFNTEINVTRDVLIPRIETEQLVDLILSDFADKKNQPVRLLDIGTGSGCIPIAINKEFPEWHCFGLDVSQPAIDLAKHNAELNRVGVTFFSADLLYLDQSTELKEMDFDVIVSNPPYIKPEEKVEMNAQVLNYEPELALFHNNPLQIYECIIEYASKMNASLYLECNDKTAADVKKVAAAFYNQTTLIKDLDGNSRFVVAKTP
ncbi:MAG: peptide chain release factor N(5)-glutamine methyltransferase [Balneolaceae bacterium]|nr:MAG: peptide chain release factor N(5)-glutamine methyltransferase [Balneolaceae bacterium]